MITSYNWVLIGERIRAERVSAGLTMEQVAEQIGSSRQTISRWERGEGVEITLNMLLRLCDIFKCELGYLLGEYNCKTRQATDIQNETGLSEKAIDALCSNKHNTNMSRFLSDLTEDTESLYFISSAYREYKQCAELSERLSLSGFPLVSPDEAGIYSAEAMRKADFILFRCQNLLLKFIQKEKSRNGKESDV